MGRQIAKRRKQLSLTQDKVAEGAKISKVYLSKIERGLVQNVSYKVLGKIANALQTTRDNLMAPSGQGEVTIEESLVAVLQSMPGIEFEKVEFLTRVPDPWMPHSPADWKHLLRVLDRIPDIIVIGKRGERIEINLKVQAAGEVTDRGTMAQRVEAEIVAILAAAGLTVLVPRVPEASK